MGIGVVIPARLESKRLPRKLLLDETGKPLLLHTIEAANGAGFPPLIAHDSSINPCDFEPWSPSFFHTSDNHPNGTSRIAELCSDDADANLIINWQADEPELRPEHIQALIRTYHQIPSCDIATLAAPFTECPGENDVRVLESNGWAVDFDRETLCRVGYRVLRHIGIYAYSPRFLRWYLNQPPSWREQAESLEQLRALDAGCRIRVAVVDHPPHKGIDTREEYEAFVRRWKEKNPMCSNEDRLSSESENVQKFLIFEKSLADYMQTLFQSTIQPKIQAWMARQMGKVEIKSAGNENENVR